MSRRRLEDLFVRGCFETFDDGKGEAVTVWLQKLSPVEMSSALRRANAARAKIRSLKADRDCEEFEDLWLEVLEWGDKSALVEYLLAEPQLRIEERIEAELAAEDEWAEEGYLQGLRDAWENGARDAHIVEPESPEGQEAARVLAELTRFSELAAARGASEIAQARAELDAMDINDLRERALDRIIRYRATDAWLAEMRRCEVFYGTHPVALNTAAAPDAPEEERWVALPERYWRKRTDFDRLQVEVLGPLLERYKELSVDVVEGKDSGEIPTSSDSSGQLPEPEMGNSSGLAAVAP